MLEERDQPPAPRLQEIASVFEHGRARFDRRRAPGGKARRRGRHCGLGDGIVALTNSADDCAIDRRAQLTLDAAASDAVDERLRLTHAFAGANFGDERGKARTVAEFDTRGVAPSRRIEIARQRDMRMTSMRGIGDPALWPLEDGGDRHRRIGHDRHEGRVGAVLKKPAHQIGQQVAVTTDGSIDAHRRLRELGVQHLVERLPHPMQTLKFEALNTTRVLDHARNRERVVGRELRIKAPPQVDELAGAEDVAEVGHGLAGEHRIVRNPALLRALDLGVPVGALDQTHHQPSAKTRAVSSSQSITALARFW